MKQEIIEINGQKYEVLYTMDTLIPEGIKYIDDLRAWTQVPRGQIEVKGPKTLTRICEKISEEI